MVFIGLGGFTLPATIQLKQFLFFPPQAQVAKLTVVNGVPFRALDGPVILYTCL
jgi:hypothetical protein